MQSHRMETIKGDSQNLLEMEQQNAGGPNMLLYLVRKQRLSKLENLSMFIHTRVLLQHG
jgi:hypothetical protein